MKSRKALISAGSGVLIGVLAALLIVFIIQPMTATKNANSRLEELGVSKGSVVAANTNLFPFEGENPLDLKTEQKGLGETSITTPPAFIFGKSGKVLEVYADFSNQRVRDFFLVNQNLLESMISRGNLTLKIYPIISSNPYSLYSAEALGESFVMAPEKAWEFFLEVLKKGAEVESRDDVLNSLTNIGTALGINIDAASINNGTLASWILSSSKDEVPETLPTLILDGSPISDDITITNTEEMKGALRGV